MTKTNISNVRIKILATSDLHMQITSFDYIRDKPTTGGSLARLSTMIARQRREADEKGQICLLVDNGDTLQGTPMAEILAEDDCATPHPMIAGMNTLGYDAGGLGNHDCDFGLEYLEKCLRQHNMPVVCTNLESPLLTTVRKSVTLRRSATASDGQDVTLDIGILSSLPDKTAAWNSHHLKDRAALSPPIASLRREATRLRQAGCDVIIVLAHTGLAIFDEGPDAQNLIAEVAQVADIDAVIGGHTHLKFPGPDHANLKAVDNVKGTVWDVPTVQPGVSGSDLGVIDLELSRASTGGSWAVTDASATLLTVDSSSQPDQRIEKISLQAHNRVRAHLASSSGSIARPMNTFFALADPSPVTALMAQAKRRAIEKAVQGTEFENIPLLAMASATLTGGYDGPDNFILLQAGEIKARHIAGLNPYANQVWAVRATGARLLDWLERSAVIFNTLSANNKDQMLINPHIPGFRYDACYGLDYVINLDRQPYFDVAGRARGVGEKRVSDVLWQGKPLDPDQEFLVATTDHRVGGGGHFLPFCTKDIVICGHAPIKSALLDYLADPNCEAVRSARPWRLTSKEPASAILLTAPEAADHLSEIEALHPEICGQTTDGFLKVRLCL